MSETKVGLFSKKQLLQKFAVFDIETTGLSYNNDDIIELAALSNNTKIEFHEYIKTSKKISPDITAINKITNSLLMARGNDINYVLNKFYDTFAGYTMIGHNAHKFDAKFILSKGGLLFNSFRFLDTKELAKFVLPGAPAYSMSYLCDLFGIEIVDQHTAMGDSKALLKLFNKLSCLLDDLSQLDKFIKQGNMISKDLMKGLMASGTK